MKALSHCQTVWKGLRVSKSWASIGINSWLEILSIKFLVTNFPHLFFQFVKEWSAVHCLCTVSDQAGSCAAAQEQEEMHRSRRRCTWGLWHLDERMFINKAVVLYFVFVLWSLVEDCGDGDLYSRVKYSRCLLTAVLFVHPQLHNDLISHSLRNVHCSSLQRQNCWWFLLLHGNYSEKVYCNINFCKVILQILVDSSGKAQIFLVCLG